jgi:hypothetical protein
MGIKAEFHVDFKNINYDGEKMHRQKAIPK